MKNKVLILSNKLPYPSDDGSSIAMARLLETLLMKELDLHYFAINTDKHYKDVEGSLDADNRNLWILDGTYLFSWRIDIHGASSRLF